MISPSTLKGKSLILPYIQQKFAFCHRYVYVLLNDFFTAANGVLIKKKLESKDLGKYGVMYYNSLFMLLPAAIFAWQTGDIQEVAGSYRMFFVDNV